MWTFPIQKMGGIYDTVHADPLWYVTIRGEILGQDLNWNGWWQEIKAGLPPSSPAVA